MPALLELLKGTETLDVAFRALKGKTLFGQPLPNPPKFTILETKGDYFIGLWKGSSKEVEFFATYDMDKIFSLTE